MLQRVRDDLTYDVVYSSEENLWSILYLTGYLTKAEKVGGGQEESGQRYAQEFKEEYFQVTCYGISFYKKRCLLQKKE